MTFPHRPDAILGFGAAGTGAEPDSLGWLIVGVSVHNAANAPVTILDYGLAQLSAETFGAFVPEVCRRMCDLHDATDCSAYNVQLVLDPDGIGVTLYEQTPESYPVDVLRNERILNMDLQQRAVAASGYVYAEQVERCSEADKIITHKGKTRNHLLHQVAAFGVNTKPGDAGVLLVSFADAVLEIFSSNQMRRRVHHVGMRP